MALGFMDNVRRTGRCCPGSGRICRRRSSLHFELEEVQADCESGYSERLFRLRPCCYFDNSRHRTAVAHISPIDYVADQLYYVYCGNTCGALYDHPCYRVQPADLREAEHEEGLQFCGKDHAGYRFIRCLAVPLAPIVTRSGLSYSPY